MLSTPETRPIVTLHRENNLLSEVWVAQFNQLLIPPNFTPGTYFSSEKNIMQMAQLREEGQRRVIRVSSVRGQQIDGTFVPNWEYTFSVALDNENTAIVPATARLYLNEIVREKNKQSVKRTQITDPAAANRDLVMITQAYSWSYMAAADNFEKYRAWAGEEALSLAEPPDEFAGILSAPKSPEQIEIEQQEQSVLNNLQTLLDWMQKPYAFFVPGQSNYRYVEYRSSYKDRTDLQIVAIKTDAIGCIESAEYSHVVVQSGEDSTVEKSTLSLLKNARWLSLTVWNEQDLQADEDVPPTILFELEQTDSGFAVQRVDKYAINWREFPTEKELLQSIDIQLNFFLLSIAGNIEAMTDRGKMEWPELNATSE